MNRRDFITTSLAAGAAASVAATPDDSAAKDANAAKEDSGAESTERHRFKLKYAPHFGMFKKSAGDDLIDQLKFMADEGFTALEDNGMRRKPVELQNKIRTEMDRLDMEMGVFVATADFKRAMFASGDKAMREEVLNDVRESVELAKRMKAKWVTVVPGKFDHKKPMGYQTANVIETLKRCAEICEPSGLVMVLEPLNHWTNHPELFLHKIPQGYMICRSVDSPSCKILFDVYHQQITEGNLIPNIDKAWEEVAYFQIGDNPGRKEPTTGEINYTNIFRHIHGKGYQGVMGMEHGNSRPGAKGEQAVIDAYVKCDKF